MNKVSVLIPAYNSSEFITDALDSCLAQEDLAGEIVVVDDGSTDDTSAVVTAWKERHAGIDVNLIQTKNCGACHARNIAFEHSTYEWVQWLDCDDILATGKVRRQLQWLSCNRDSLAYSGWKKFNDYPTDSTFAEWDMLKDEYSPSEWIESRTMGIPGCWLGHRSFFESIGPWNESLSINQDGEYFTRAIVKARSIGVIKNTGVHYRIGHHNRTSNFTADKAKSLYRSIESFEKEVNRLDAELSQVIAEQYQAFIHRVYPHCRKKRKEAQQKVKELAREPIENHLLESERSKRWAAIIGWRTFVLLRQCSWAFRKK